MTERTKPRERSGAPGFFNDGGVGLGPGLGLGHGPVNPENHEGGQDADEEDPTLRAGRRDVHQQADEDGPAERGEVDAVLEDRGHPRASGFRPGLGKQGRADGPFAADVEGGEKRGPDIGAPLLDLRVGGIGRVEQLHDEGQRDERGEVQLQSVEKPTQPGGDPGLRLA